MPAVFGSSACATPAIYIRPKSLSSPIRVRTRNYWYILPGGMFSGVELGLCTFDFSCSRSSLSCSKRRRLVDPELTKLPLKTLRRIERVHQCPVCAHIGNQPAVDELGNQHLIPRLSHAVWRRRRIPDQRRHLQSRIDVDKTEAAGTIADRLPLPRRPQVIASQTVV
jgi:hypothetical protein